MANEIIIKVVLAGGDAQKSARDLGQSIKSALDSSGIDRAGANVTKQFLGIKNSAIDANRSMAGLSGTARGLASVFGTLASIGLAGTFTALGKTALDSAIKLDKNRQTLIALTGSADAANKKLQQLRELAKQTPGLTVSLANSIFAQLKVTNAVADQTIDKLLKSFGKLNAVFNIEDADGFARNLIQIFSGSFERSDVKEALQRVPIFEQLLESAFGTKDPDKLRKLKEAGTLTFEGFLQGFITAIEKRFPNATESIGTQLQKFKDEILSKLAPLGERIASILLPALEQIIPVITRVLDLFAKLPPSLQAGAIGFLAVGTALSPVVIGLSGVIQSLTAIAALGGIPSIFGSLGSAGIVAGLAPIGPLILGISGLLVAGGIAWIEYSRQVENSVNRINQAVINAAPIASRGGRFAEGADFASLQEQLKKQSPTEFLKPGGVDLSNVNIITGKPLTTTQAAAAVKQQIKQVTGGTRPTGGGGTRAEKISEFQQELNALNATIATNRKLLDSRSREFDLAVRIREERIETLKAERLISEEADRRLGIIRQFPEVPKEEIKPVPFGTTPPLLDQIPGLRLDQLEIPNAPIERLQQLNVELTNGQRFLAGFEDSVLSVGDAFDRFGSNVASAFGNIKTLFDSLKNAVKQFFNDLLASSLQNLLRGTLGMLFGGGIVGGGGGGGGLGGFRTPNFNPNTGGGGIGGVLGSIFNSGGVRAPSSVSGVLSGVSSGGLPIINTGAIDAITKGALKTSALGGVGGLFGNLLKGIGFGLPRGSTRGGLAGALPLLGLSLGAGVGGQSGFGQILGGAGGALLGVGLTAAPASLGAFGFLAPLFSNPITAIAGGALLVGGFLFGKAKQRKRDEEASGQFLTQALNEIANLKSQVASGQVDGSQARSIFENQILATFINQINTLKTKSVRQSRLTNQVRDLRKVFEDSVVPEIEGQNRRRVAAEQRQSVFSKQIPEFATGGIVRGLDRGFDSVLAALRPGEMVLTQAQQARIAAMAGSDVFRVAGVPNQGGPTDTQQQFAIGGVAARGLGGKDAPIVVDVVLVAGTDTQDEFFASAIRRDTGRRLTIGTVRNAVINRDI